MSTLLISIPCNVSVSQDRSERQTEVVELCHGVVKIHDVIMVLNNFVVEVIVGHLAFR
jgi:hypothetical protein